MTLPPRLLALLTVAAFIPFAGCLGGGTDEDPTADLALPDGPVDANLLKGGRDLRKELWANDTLEAPQWQLGQFFGHHVFLGQGDDQGIHINTYVVEDRGSSWFLATDDEEMAILEGAFDIPILGEVSKKDLSTTAFGTDWNWLYDFPITDGKTWTKDVPMLDWQTGEIVNFPASFKATYAPAITLGDGSKYPGFEIVGTLEDGSVLVESDFTPAVGWYAHFTLYDPFTADDTEDFQFHVMSMGFGKDWRGSYYESVGKVALEHVSGTALVAGEDLEPAVPPYAAAAPYATFTVSDTATHLYGFAFGFAFGGAQALVLVDPANEHREWTAAGMEGFEEDLLLPAIAGEWKVVSPSAGVVAIEGIFLWEVTVTEKTFEPPAGVTTQA